MNSMASAEWYIGLMSGTSLDGVDAVLASFSPRIQVHAHASVPMPQALREQFLSLNQPGANELHRAALAANALVDLYVQAVKALLQHAPVQAQAIRAVGAHGQTVRHQPGLHDGVGYTWQLNQPALLAEKVGMDVVADFRSRDVAAGGQGAPLVPAFHHAWLHDPQEDRAVLNLGGIANLSLVPASGQVLGFDCGPANALMDRWCELHTGQRFDDQGQWAASGQVQPDLLSLLIAHPYFERPVPKSTGLDDFHLAWLQAQLEQLGRDVAGADVQATLLELSVRTVANDLNRHAPQTRQLVVCGGGALNGRLMQRLAEALPRLRIQPSDDWGLPVMQVEAAAFAWLAHQTVHKKAGNLPAVTGAKGLRVLGAIYPA